MRGTQFTTALVVEPTTPGGSGNLQLDRLRGIRQWIGIYGFALFAPTIALAYSGNTVLALVPLLAAALYVSTRPDAVASLKRLGVFLASMCALVIAALLSTFAHPSPNAAYTDQTLLAGVALAIALAVDRRPQTFYLMLSTSTLLTLVLWLLTVVANPYALNQKSPVTALSGAPSPLAAVGDLRWTLHPNEVGVLASITAVCWLGLTLQHERLRRWLSALMLALTLAILVDSGSRGGYVAFAGGAIVVLVLRWRLLLWPSVIVVLAVASLYAVTQTFQLAPGSAAPLQSRLVTWITNLRLILDSPWLGRGIASYQALHPTGLSATNGTHNTFLQIWLEFGLLGALAVAALTVYSLRTAFKGLHIDVFGGAMVGACFAWLLHSMFESTIIVGWHLGWRFEAPWQEMAVPLAFAIWGLAASRAQLEAPRDSE
jgi:O-antigen ligase